MRLLLTTDAVGGVWTYSLDLARALAPHGTETVLAVMGPGASAPQRAEAGTIAGLKLIETSLPLDWLAETPGELRAAGAALARLAGEVGADLVQLHAPALAAGADWPVPVVAVHHSCVATWWAAVRGGELPQDFAWRAKLIGEGLRTVDASVAPSVAHAAAVAATYGVRPRAVHNGRAPLPLPGRARVDAAFTCGRLWDAAKGGDVFDRAAAFASVPFRAAGPLQGPNGEEVGLAHAEGLGALNEDALAAELAGCPVFVSPASYEPFGLAVLEAAQAGCALVLADLPTFRELWDGAATFVPSDDPAAIARAVDGLIADPDARDRAGAAALERAVRYTPATTAAGMMTIYRELAAQPLERAA